MNDRERRAYKRRLAHHTVDYMTEAELDAVLIQYLGLDPAKVKLPLPDPSLMEELDGGPG
jgi:hypothetical protein